MANLATPLRRPNTASTIVQAKCRCVTAHSVDASNTAAVGVLRRGQKVSPGESRRKVDRRFCGKTGLNTRLAGRLAGHISCWITGDQEQLAP